MCPAAAIVHMPRKGKGHPGDGEELPEIASLHSAVLLTAGAVQVDSRNAGTA
jgi:hypothetical protein